MAFNIVYNVPAEMAEALEAGWAQSLNETVMATYPFAEAMPVEAVALLVAMVAFIFVSIATQNGQDLPADLHPLFER